jgi:hypothetical protein
MWNKRSWLAITLVLVAGFGLAGCGESEGATATGDAPVKVEQADGAETATVELTEQAVDRLDLQTATVRDEQVAGQQRKVIPYAAVIYDPEGQAWTFTNPQPLTYVRERISVDQISGDMAVLTDGPAAGTTVVTTGAAELYGAELGIGITD